MKTNTVKADLPLSVGMGSRNENRLSHAFPASPLAVGTNEYSELLVKSIGDAALLGNGGDGDEVSNIGIKEGIINDNGYMFGSFSLNFSDAPDLDSVETGGEGLPASPFVPNIASSPGASHFNQPVYEGELPKKNNGFGVGLGGAISPSQTSQGISGNSLGDYILGPIAGQSLSYRESK